MPQLAIAAAACGFGTVSVLAKLAYDAGSPPRALFASRVVVAGALLAPLALRAPQRLSSRRVGLAAGGGAAFCAAGLLEFEALSRLPASVFVPIVFVAPLWVALLSLVLFRTRPPRRTAWMFPLVLGGLALLAGASGGSDVDPVGVSLALGASFLFAAVFVILERLLAYDPPARAVACVMLFAAVLASVLGAPAVVSELTTSPDFAYALAVGAITATSLVLLAAGMAKTGAFRAAIITGAEPLAAALLGWLVLQEVLTTGQLVGGVFVVAGVVGVSAGSNAR
jgi:drug/metabolite transporter, DME family